MLTAQSGSAVLWPGGRKHAGLAVVPGDLLTDHQHEHMDLSACSRSSLVQDLLDLWFEAHVQHSVCLPARCHVRSALPTAAIQPTGIKSPDRKLSVSSKGHSQLRSGTARQHNSRRSRPRPKAEFNGQPQKSPCGEACHLIVRNKIVFSPPEGKERALAPAPRLVSDTRLDRARLAASRGTASAIAGLCFLCVFYV